MLFSLPATRVRRSELVSRVAPRQARAEACSAKRRALRQFECGESRARCVKERSRKELIVSICLLCAPSYLQAAAAVAVASCELSKLRSTLDASKRRKARAFDFCKMKIEICEFVTQNRVAIKRRSFECRPRFNLQSLRNKTQQ